MVEFALVAPLFFAIVFGGIEMGLMFRTYLAMENLSRSASRIASIERETVDADGQVLDRVAVLTAPLQGEIESIIIFKADTLDSDVPTACLSASVSNVCNHYDIENAAGGISAVAASAMTSPQTAWAPSSRSAGDNIGIHIEFTYDFATGFFDTLDMSSSTVEVIEQDF